MERRSLLSVLNPQLQALVEASLGETLAQSSSPVTPAVSPQPSVVVAAVAGGTAKLRDGVTSENEQVTHGLNANQSATTQQVASTAVPFAKPSVTRGGVGRADAPLSHKLNPSELFVLRHPSSPGFVVKEHFLGSTSALALRQALLPLAATETFHEAKVGHGDHLRSAPVVRGDRIHWLKRPSDLSRPNESSNNGLSPAILHLMKSVESLVYGVKSAVPSLNIRNVTSTQLAIFPGGGTRFVRHADTYSSSHQEVASKTSSASLDGLVRVLTCVYYLNEQWEPEHGGKLRVYVNGESSSSSGSHWDVAPKLDTLVVFRSLDVEHEVLPAFQERMALTIWYYGRAGRQQSEVVNAETLASLPVSSPKPLPIKQPEPSESSASVLGDTIFVAVPSYRDPECRHTVDNLLSKATHPSRIRIGICLQDDEQEDDTRQYLEAKYSPEQVRIKYVDYRDAAGPCVARFEAQKLWESEKFYLQIDSHMRFREGWDAFLIDQLSKCASAKPILTTYPLGYTLPNKVSTDIRPTLLCASSFDEHGILRQASKTLATTSPVPLASSFWAAGFAFSSARVIEEVPYDESLRFLFFGEEASMSARLWTNGWDFFSPGESAIYHLWTRSYRRVFQEIEDQETAKWRSASQRYVKKLLTEPSEVVAETNGSEEERLLVAGKYLLGTERSVSAYESRIGVSFEKREIRWEAEWGSLDPIYFELSAEAADVHAPVQTASHLAPSIAGGSLRFHDA